MEELSSKHKVALEALFVVERYVSSLKNTRNCGFNELSKADRETKDLLNQGRFPREVRQAVDKVTNAVLESYIATRALIEKDNKLKVEQTRRKRTEYFIVILYVLTIFAAFWVKDWKLVLACFPFPLSSIDRSTTRFLFEYGKTFGQKGINFVDASFLRSNGGFRNSNAFAQVSFHFYDVFSSRFVRFLKNYLKFARFIVLA